MNSWKALLLGSILAGLTFIGILYLLNVKSVTYLTYILILLSLLFVTIVYALILCKIFPEKETCNPVSDYQCKTGH